MNTKQTIKQKIWEFFRPTKLKLIIVGGLIFLLFLSICLRGSCYPREGDFRYNQCGKIINLFDIFMWIMFSPTIILDLFEPIISYNILSNFYLFIFIIIFSYYLIACLIESVIKILKRKRCNFVVSIIILVILSCSFVTAISDSNYNNNKMSVSIDVIDTSQNFNILFKKYTLDENEQYNNFDQAVKEHFNFINKTYPLADDDLTYNMEDTPLRADVTTRGFVRIAALVEYNWLDLFIKDFRKQTLIEGQGIRKVVGITPNHFFEDASTNNFFDGVKGVSVAGIPNVVLAEESSVTTSAHEMGHTYGLCDERNYTISSGISVFENQALNSFNGCPNGDMDTNNLLDSRCIKTVPTGSSYDEDACPVENDSMIINLFFADDPPLNLFNLMGVFPPLQNLHQRWIDRESYNVLLTDFSNSPPLFQNGTVVIISGTINKSYGVTLDNFYLADGGFVSSQEEYQKGNLSIKVEDETNKVLFNLSFNPGFALRVDNGSSIEINETSFVVVVPFENASQFIFENNVTKETLIDRNRTSNSPIVSLSAPTSGQVFYNPFVVDWSASDADGDSMAYAVLLSQDGGDNFTTWAIDLNDSNVTIDNKYFENSTKSVVKILATDGVNTNLSLSANFTIVPSSVRIYNFTDLTPTSTSKVFEVIIENDGNVPLSNLSWVFNSSEGVVISSVTNIPLNVSEKAFVYVAHNYASLNITVSFNVSNGVVSDVWNTYTAGDTIIPSIEFVSPTSSSGVHNQNFIAANVSASDANLDTITIYLYNGVSLVQSNSSSTSPFLINFTFLPYGTYYLNATANDTFGNLNRTETRTIILGIPSFIIENSTDGNVASFFGTGDVVLKGSCFVSANCGIPTNSFVIENALGNVVGHINSTSGNLCIESGDCSDLSASCNAPADSFIIQNSSGSTVSYIDSTGDLCLTGVLTENTEP